jgi:hypothetical protein
MFGGDLPSNDAFTLALLTNPEVLAVDQNSAAGHQSYHQGDTIAWTADAPGGAAKYVAVFNVGDAKQDVALNWSDVGIPAKSAKVRDLWAHTDLGKQNRLQVSLAPHASALYKIDPKH